MQFRDREGRPLAVGQWHELFASPKYSIVKRDVKRHCGTIVGEVLTSWIGMIQSGEPRKNLFMVDRARFVRSGNNSELKRERVETAWAETEQQALEIHAMYQRRM